MSYVSVIIPFYNAEKYISQSIESVLHQTYTDWELILINDGSTDNSKSIVLQYLNHYKVKYYEQENKGQASARNVGINNASGALIAFLDADDVWTPSKLEIQVPLLADSVDLVFSNAQIIDQEGKPTGEFLNPGCGSFSGFSAFTCFIKGQYFAPTLTVLCRKSLICKVDFFDENNTMRNAEDFDLWVRMLLNGAQFYGMKEVTAFYRVHTSQSSGSDLANNLAVTESLFKLRGRYPKYLHPINLVINKRLLYYFFSDMHGNEERVKSQIMKLYPTFKLLHMLIVKLFGLKYYFKSVGFFFLSVKRLLFSSRIKTSNDKE